MDSAENIFANDNFAKHIGIELIRAEDGCAEAKVKLEDCHLNAYGIGHCGLLYSLSVWACAVALYSIGTKAVALNGSISYLSVAEAGSVVYAKATTKRDGKKISHASSELVDQDGKLVAIFNMTGFRVE